MSLPDMKYPVVALLAGAGDFRIFEDVESLLVRETWDGGNLLQGMLLVDSGGSAWEVVSVRFGKAVGSFWSRLTRALVRQSRRQVEYDVTERAHVPFEELKARICQSIENDPDSWRDDELIAGEAGPPIDEEVLLEGWKEAIRRAATIEQIIENLDRRDASLKGDPSGFWPSPA